MICREIWMAPDTPVHVSERRLTKHADLYVKVHLAPPSDAIWTRVNVLRSQLPTNDTCNSPRTHGSKSQPFVSGIDLYEEGLDSNSVLGANGGHLR